MTDKSPGSLLLRSGKILKKPPDLPERQREVLFPYMQTVRFLADYINGDTYYKIQYPEHNLVRSKAQFKLLQSVEAHQPEMQAFIAEVMA